MPIKIIKLPDIGEGLAEAEIVKWHVADGDLIKENDALVDVTTDKATVEIPAPVAGTIITRNGNVGDMLAVGAQLVVIKTEHSSNEPQASDQHPAQSEDEAGTRSLDAGMERT